MEFTTAKEVWEIRPIPFKGVMETELSSQYYQILQKWLAFANAHYEKWDNKPNCGYFFSGSYYYATETTSPTVVCAVLSKVGKYEEDITGVTRKQLMDKAIGAIRYLGFTHDTGPQDCVRVAGDNPSCSEKKWGGEGDPYFFSTQNGRSVMQLALAAWFLWDELDVETKLMVQNVVASYADRWCDQEPRDGTYYDTQEEENSWVASGIAAAADLFPNHPHYEQWRAGFICWAMNSVTTFKDRFNQEALVPIKTATLHPDFTAENHGFVHPTYMQLGINQRAFHVVFSLIGGYDKMPGALYNNELLYDRTIKVCTQSDGFAIPVQGQDWWYNRQHELCLTHTILNVLHDNSDAARMERNTLEQLEKLQESNRNGCLLEENGQECSINQYQTAQNFEGRAAFGLLMCYLLHIYGGQETEPSVQDEMLERLSGVYSYPYGSFILHRTKHSTNVFSWRNRVMAVALPKKGIWNITPAFNSMTGMVQFNKTNGIREWINELLFRLLVKDTVKTDIICGENSFSAVVTVARGDNELMQDIAFVSLPNGHSVYMEQFRAIKPCSVAHIETGLLGVRNEKYAAIPDLAPGQRTIYFEHGSDTFKGYNGRDPDMVKDYPAVDFLNIDQEIGYIISGSNGIRYVNRHNPKQWKGVEDLLILNYTDNISFQGNEICAPFIVETLPNLNIEETATLAARSISLSCEQNRLILWEAGDYLAYANFHDTGRIVKGQKSIKQDTVSLYEGSNRIEGSQLTWTGKLEGYRSGFLESRCQLSQINTSQMILDVDVLADRMIFHNSSEEKTSFVLLFDQNRQKQSMEIAAGAYVSFNL